MLGMPGLDSEVSPVTGQAALGLRPKPPENYNCQHWQAGVRLERPGLRYRLISRNHRYRFASERI